MNISELARRLRVSTEELRSKLPELGFDIGGKAIKIPDRDAGRIMNAWQEYKKRQYLQQKMENQKAQLLLKEKVKSGDAPRVKIPQTLTVREFATAEHAGGKGDAGTHEGGNSGVAERAY
jgi:hypothetical protein